MKSIVFQKLGRLLSSWVEQSDSFMSEAPRDVYSESSFVNWSFSAARNFTPLAYIIVKIESSQFV